MNNFFYTLTKFFISLALIILFILIYKSEIVHSGNLRDNYQFLFILFSSILILSIINFS